MDAYKLSKDEAKILILLHKATEHKKNLHYLAGRLNKSYHTLYHKVRVLCEMGMITTVKSSTRKTFYHVQQTSFDSALNVLNNEGEA